MHQLSVKVLKNVIAQTNFAVSTSETRPVLTGVNWLIQDNELICTATDSHRLAVRKLQLEDTSENVIIPGKALSELKYEIVTKILISSHQTKFYLE